MNVTANDARKAGLNWWASALCLVLLTCTAAWPEEARGIKLSGDFDNGSLGDWELVGPDTIKFTLTEASGGVWSHFRIQGVKGRTVTFLVPMTVDLGRITAHYYDGRNRPAYSYDRKRWELAPPGRVDKEAKTFSFQVTFEADVAWVAYTIPYTNETLEGLLGEYADSPYLRVRTLATTAESRPVHWLLIGDEPDREQRLTRRVVWLVARESGWDAPGSWMADGFVRFALGAGGSSRRFRQRVIVNVVPILAPDAVAGGWMFYPTAGGKQPYLPMMYDRDYPEVVGLKRAVRDGIARGGTIDFALRLHSAGWMSTQHTFWQELYLPQEQVEFDGLLDRFRRLVLEARWARQHVFPQRGFVEYCFKNFQIKGGTIALGLGAKGNTMTEADLQDVGQALGEALLGLYTEGFMGPFGEVPPSR